MRKTRLQQPTSLMDAIRTCASSPCWGQETDPGDLGYRSPEEIVPFLTSLLQREQIGGMVFGDIDWGAERGIADLILEYELDQQLICIILQNEIAKRGVAIASPHRPLANNRRIKSSLAQAATSATSHQAELVQRIEEGVLNIFDAELNVDLKKFSSFIASK